MKRIAICCCLLAVILLSSTPSFSQCTPDPNCTPAQLICPPVLSPGCEGDAYAQTITISLGGTIAGFPLTDLTVSNLAGLPPGLSFSCSPPGCGFAANTSGCILISGTPTTAGTYPIRANLLVNIGFVVPIDTAVGSIVIQAKDCAGVCGGTASIDNCGVCSGGTTGVTPNCEDGDACTTDACDGGGGCLNTPIVCDDGDSCTTNVCDNGTCFYLPIAGCGADPCANSTLSLDFTSQDVCDGDTATLTNNSVGLDPAGTFYIDQGSDGTIDMTLPASVLPVGSSQSITVNGSVQITIIAENPDGCRDTFAVDIQGIVCNDGDACTTDACDNTICSATPIVCDDADSCTTDACDNGVCVYTPIAGCGGDPCANSTLALNFTFQDVCDGDTATLTNNSVGLDPAGTFYIDQGSDGTIDMTLPASVLPVGSSQSITVNGSVQITIIAENPDGCRDTFAVDIQGIVCNDGDACTTDACDNTVCAATPIICDDADSCTTDACDNGVCVYTPIAGCGGDPCTNSTLALNFTFQDVCDGDTATLTNNSAGLDPTGTFYIDQGSDGTIDMTLPASVLPVGSSQSITVNGSVQITIIAENPDGCRDTFAVNIQGIVCDDGDACTTDACANALCSATPVVCDDGDTCTTDACDNGLCLYTPIAGCGSGTPCANGPFLDFAFQQDACQGDTATITNNSAGVDPAGTYHIDQGSDGTIDQSFPASFFPVGTTQNLAVSGSVSITIIGENPDGCTDTFLVTIQAIVCDDGDSCTTDICDNGVCSYVQSCCVTNGDCDDNDACTIDSCAGSQCANTPINCDDGNACTTDACDNGLCVSTPVVCDDNNACTLDSCSAGLCVFSAINCDDGDSCTADACVNGVCTNIVTCCVTNADCDDNDGCTTDSCNGGACLNTPLNCDDGDSCTVDVCDNGVCVNTNACCTDDSDCLDGDLCTLDECVNGLCVSQPRCDDANACTDDHCSYYNHGHWNHGCHGGHNGNHYHGGGHFSGHHGNHGLVCYHTPIDCRDGDRCTTDECVNGQCVNTPINCDDGDSCTTDQCVLGICKHFQTCCSSNSDCADNDPCTIDSCAAAVCLNTPMNCDDGDVCTDDACNRGWHYYNDDDDDDGGWHSHHGGGWHNDDDDDDGGWHDDDDDNGPTYVGTCVHHPVDCRDGNVCTTDYCDTLAGCAHDTIAGCCLSHADCDDSDVCTADKCQQNRCRYSAVGGNVQIETDGDWCQDGGVMLEARAAAGSTFAWSTGETTETIRGFADSTYSVTATNPNGCESADTITIGSAENLLSSYVILADQKVRLSRNTVFSGGVGARDNNADIYLKSFTNVTAAGTFVRGDDLFISNSSTVTTRFSTRANIALPPYETNPYPGGMDVTISSATTATLNGSVYDDITIGAGSVITFTQTNLYFDNLYLRDNVTLKFAACTKIHIRDRLRLGDNNIFNPDENDVIVYVDDHVEVGSGSTVTADIYVRDGDIYLQASSASAPSVMKGLFIAERVEARDNAHWHTNPNCNDSCSGNLQPLIVYQKNDGSETNAPSMVSEELKFGEAVLKAYPNPFSEVLNIEFTVATDSRVKLEIFNLGGQQLATVFEGQVIGGETRKVQFKPESNAHGMLIYRLQTEQGTFFGKAVMAK